MGTSQSVGERVREARCMVEDLTAVELSELARLPSSAHVGMIERGDVREPRLGTIGAIARALGVSMEWLLTGAGDPPTKRGVRSSIVRARAARDRAA